MAHKTDYKDALFAKRIYRQTNNTDGTVSFEDATEYTQEGDRIGAKYCNEIGAALNALENPTFSQAATRVNINSGESMPTILGKVKKWFADLGAAAFYAVANNCTTTAAGSVLDARQGKTLMDNYNQLNSNFAYDENGIYGYIRKKDGADTVIPFSPTPATDGTFFANTNQGHYGFLIEKPDNKIIKSVTISPVGTLTDTVYVRKNNNTSASDAGTLVGTVTGSSPVTFEIGSDAENITIVTNTTPGVWAYRFGYSVIYTNDI